MSNDTSLEDSTKKKRKRLRRLVVPLLIILFFFLAPVVPLTVTRISLLPWRNQCYGLILSNDPLLQPVPIYASISYATVQGVLEITSNEHQGFLGLIIVPNGPNTVQFPPLGYTEYSCL